MPSYSWSLGVSSGSSTTTTLSSGAGLSPAGLGTPTANTQLVGPGYQVGEGGCVSSVKIAWGTKDYEYDDYGNEKPMSDTAQRIQICMGTTKGARLNFQSFGLETPDTIDSGRIQRQVEHYVRAACRPVLSDGSATITSVEVETEGNQVLAVIRWTDNRRQTTETTRAPLAQ